MPAMPFVVRVAVLTACLTAATGARAAESAPSAQEPSAADLELFEKKVRPILVERCESCHSEKANKKKGGLWLDRRAAWVTGGDTGPAIVPGDPEKSLLIKAVRRTSDDLTMPPDDKLPAAEIAILEDWVRRGAPDPRTGKAAPPVDLAALARGHWALQAPRELAPPACRAREFCKNPIDAFILARQQEQGLTPAPPADRRTLIRRVTYDLHGLPPSAEEIDAFLRDSSPRAYEKVVDRLLASPRYGERCGRQWLDVARYADTKGYVFREERRYPFAFTYRDWVVRALNEDLPYDRFLQLQIAADRIVGHGKDAGDKRDLAAMGFLTLGRRFLNRLPDIIDDRIDVLMRGTMGLTVACARCHDHKFDPVTTKDYYALYGVLASSEEPKELPIIGRPRTPQEVKDAADYARELQKRKAEAEELRGKQVAAMNDLLRAGKTITAYLEAAIAARAMKQDDLKTYLQQKELSGFVLARWQALLAKTAPPGTKVMGAQAPRMGNEDDDEAPKEADEGPLDLHALTAALAPWHALVPLSEAQLTAEGPAALEHVRDALAKPETVSVAEAFVTAPASHKELAERYGAAFGRVDLPIELRAPLHAPRVGPLVVEPTNVSRVTNRKDREALQALEQRVAELQVTHPGAPPAAHVLKDVAKPGNARVFIRGNPDNPGEEVPRRFLSVLGGERPATWTSGSGRLELAQAIASAANPLTARVLVNRLWLGHFGAGLVRTPSDFGTRGERPTHPELLDWLARRFVKDGWSQKRLHKLIVLSGTYQQASDADPETLKKDPQNFFLSHQSRRRLDFEGMRDTLLAAAGRLDVTVGGRAVPFASNPSMKQRQEGETIRNGELGDPSQDQFAVRRSLYLFVDRQNLPGLFRDFDFANPDSHSPQRFQTSVPQQALFLLNSPFVVEQARALIARSDVRRQSDPERRVQMMYRALFGRVATPAEVDLARRFLASEAPRDDDRVAEVIPAWQYGYGRWDDERRRVTGFTSLPHYTGMAWQGSAKLPDAKLAWVMLSASGGHPGPDGGHAAIRRWVAPRDGEVAVSGLLMHGSDMGDGIEARIVSSRVGELAAFTVQNSEADTRLGRLQVRQGDTLDFVVTPRGDDQHDGFAWAPSVKMKTISAATGGEMTLEWSATGEFAGPQGKRKPLDAWEKYAQVLLLSNDLMFVD